MRSYPNPEEALHPGVADTERRMESLAELRDDVEGGSGSRLARWSSSAFEGGPGAA